MAGDRQGPQGEIHGGADCMIGFVPDRLLSLKEVSKMLHIRERQVRNWVIQGRLKAMRPTSQGFVIRVKESELRRFLAGQREDEDDNPAKPA